MNFLSLWPTTDYRKLHQSYDYNTRGERCPSLETGLPHAYLHHQIRMVPSSGSTTTRPSDLSFQSLQQQAPATRYGETKNLQPHPSLSHSVPEQAWSPALPHPYALPPALTADQQVYLADNASQSLTTPSSQFYPNEAASQPPDHWFAQSQYPSFTTHHEQTYSIPPHMKPYGYPGEATGSTSVAGTAAYIFAPETYDTPFHLSSSEEKPSSSWIDPNLNLPGAIGASVFHHPSPYGMSYSSHESYLATTSAASTSTFSPTATSLPPTDDLIKTDPLSFAPPPSSSSEPVPSSSSDEHESDSDGEEDQLTCQPCDRSFGKRNSYFRHQETIHGRKEAGQVLQGEIKWSEAPALMDMALRKHFKDKDFKEVLKAAVRAFRANEDVDIPRYNEAFRKYAQQWQDESKCPKCRFVFSRRDAAGRNHKCVEAKK